jgi:hypothetical protein
VHGPGAFATRLIYNAAAAVKTVSVFIQARSAYPTAILVKSFGHSTKSYSSPLHAPCPSVWRLYVGLVTGFIEALRQNMKKEENGPLQDGRARVKLTPITTTYNFWRRIMSEQTNPAYADDMEAPASGLLISVEPLQGVPQYKAAAPGDTDTDGTDTADGTDGSDTDGTDDAGSDSDGVDAADADGTDDDIDADETDETDADGTDA